MAGADAGSAPALPDTAALARLASELFAAWPGPMPAAGGVAVPLNPQPGGLSLPPGSFGPATPAALPAPGLPPGAHLLPTSPQTPANVLAQAPALLPHTHSAQGLPEQLVTAAPGYDGRLGGPALGVAPAGSTPRPHQPAFYFIDTAEAPPSPPTPHAAAAAAAFDVHAVRRDFPILHERVNGQPLVWFDNAATTQKPRCVIERLAHFYEHENSNIHRAAHALAARATDAYEHARETVRRFVGAGSTDEIVFVRGATEAINLVARSWGAANIGAGDEIVLSHLEHHANIVPWQTLAAEKGAQLRVIPVDDSGQVRLDEAAHVIGPRTKLVAVTQVSNALGTVVPVPQIVALAHAAGAKVLVDGAQSVSHLRTDVRALDADFFVFSGHKVFGPTGIGVLYGRRSLLEQMPPWQGGGNMIADVSFERTLYQGPPSRFEAGTGNIADAVGLAAALAYVERIGIEAIAAYEHALLEYAGAQMATIPGLRAVGTAREKASVLSFVLAGHRTDDVGQALNREGIAVRTGHHCAQPILRRFGLEATVRPSLAFYNTADEVDRMVAVLRSLARAPVR